jgi:hypothetical protein
MIIGRTVLYSVSGIILFLFLSTQNKNQIDKAGWLLGTWENKTPRGSVFEQWTKISENEMFGRSYALRGADTIFFEQIELIEDHDSLFYIPTVSNQNDGLPIQFALTSMTDSSMIFKHPHHDFPQQISYVKINQDSLVASISGISNGEQREVIFPMKRLH